MAGNLSSNFKEKILGKYIDRTISIPRIEDIGGIIAKRTEAVSGSKNLIGVWDELALKQFFDFYQSVIAESICRVQILNRKGMEIMMRPSTQCMSRTR